MKFRHMIRTDSAVTLEGAESALTTKTGVEIGKVGDAWPAQTGPFTLTQEHLKSIVASQEDPAIKAPRVKIGHDSFLTPDDPNSVFGGKPVFGKFTNLRLTDNDNTLIGDIVGIPKWAAEVLPYAWPSRSGEWLRDWDNYGTAKTTYPMVLTAVALLGVELPGITTIEDLPAFFTAEGPEGVKVIVDGALVRASSKEATKTTMTKTAGNVVITSIDSGDVRESFFTDFAPWGGERQWWWPTDVFISPTAVIADDDEGGLWFVTYSVGDNDEITWDEPVGAKHQFVSKEDGAVLAGIAQSPVMRSAVADAIRPADRRRKKTTQTKETSPVKPEVIQQVRALHGLTEDQLPDDANEDTLVEVLSGLEPAKSDDPPEETPEEKQEEQPEAVPTSLQGLKLPPGVSLIETETLQEMRTGLQRLTKKDEEATKREREKVVTTAIVDRKIPSGRKAHYTKLMERDPEGTIALLNSLEKGAVPGPAVGTDEDIAARSAVQGTGLLPELNRDREGSAA